MAGDKYTERLAEVSAALFTLLIAVEALLFNADRVRDDGADVVTLAAFGGLAAAVLRDRLPWGGREAASATLGFIAGLAVFHGTRGDIAATRAATSALSVSQWTIDRSLGVAALTGVVIALGAEVVQGGVQAALQKLGRREVLVALAVGGIVLGLVVVGVVLTLADAALAAFLARKFHISSFLTVIIALAIPFLFAILYTLFLYLVENVFVRGGRTERGRAGSGGEH